MVIDDRILAWVLKNRLVTGDGERLEFHNHRFLIDPYNDISPRQVVRKSAQIGWSVMEILKATWLAAHRGMHCAYTLPTRSIVKEFVDPKVNPLFQRNPALKKLVGETDTVSLKKIGDRFLYFRGSFEETEAISISADLLIHDEVDRSDRRVLEMYESRLAASKFGWLWEFSNPSVPGIGVDEHWPKSDQKEWSVCCFNGHHELLRWPESIDPERRMFQCAQCKVELSDDDRRRGAWIPQAPGKEWSGYHVSQLLDPRKTAGSILDLAEGKDTAYFQNFVLGNAYVPAESMLSPADFRGLIDEKGAVRTTNMAMGVDVGIVKHYVVLSEYGVIRIGKTESWEEIERVMLAEGVRACVIDAQPEITIPRTLAKKYPGRVFLAWYRQEQRKPEGVAWDSSVVKLDRTAAIDLLAADVHAGNQRINLAPGDAAELIEHCCNVYRVTKDTPLGVKASWERKEGKPDHMLHALIYSRAALARISEAVGQVVRQTPPERETNPTVDPIRQTVPGIDIAKAARRSSGKRSQWQYR